MTDFTEDNAAAFRTIAETPQRVATALYAIESHGSLSDAT